MERTWGDCYGYALVATGRAEVALDDRAAVWDVAALLPIIEEAGGKLTDWSGRRTIRGGAPTATPLWSGSRTSIVRLIVTVP